MERKGGWGGERECTNKGRQKDEREGERDGERVAAQSRLTLKQTHMARRGTPPPPAAAPARCVTSGPNPAHFNPYRTADTTARRATTAARSATPPALRSLSPPVPPSLRPPPARPSHCDRVRAVTDPPRAPSGPGPHLVRLHVVEVSPERPPHGVVVHNGRLRRESPAAGARRGVVSGAAALGAAKAAAALPVIPSCGGCFGGGCRCCCCCGEMRQFWRERIAAVWRVGPGGPIVLRVWTMRISTHCASGKHGLGTLRRMNPNRAAAEGLWDDGQGGRAWYPSVHHRRLRSILAAEGSPLQLSRHIPRSSPKCGLRLVRFGGSGYSCGRTA